VAEELGGDAGGAEGVQRERHGFLCALAEGRWNGWALCCVINNNVTDD
jgi:hypothetical protein